MIDARMALQAAAVALGWVALTLAALVSSLPVAFAALAAVLATASLRRGWGWVMGLVVAAVVILLGSAPASAALGVVAPATGVLMLAALVLSDLADHATGASAAAVAVAIRRMLPGFFAAGCAVAVVAVAGWFGQSSSDGALAAAAPWLLLAAVMIALPIGTRRGFWAFARSNPRGPGRQV
jgi:hypothetical protein